jgi:hypothetical protein
MQSGQQVEQVDEPSNNAPGSQESALFADFSQLVLDGRLDPSWGRISLLTQRVMDACLRSAHAGGTHLDLAG